MRAKLIINDKGRCLIGQVIDNLASGCSSNCQPKLLHIMQFPEFNTYAVNLIHLNVGLHVIFQNGIDFFIFYFFAPVQMHVCYS